MNKSFISRMNLRNRWCYNDDLRLFSRQFINRSVKYKNGSLVSFLFIRKEKQKLCDNFANLFHPDCFQLDGEVALFLNFFCKKIVIKHFFHIRDVSQISIKILSFVGVELSRRRDKLRFFVVSITLPKSFSTKI